MEFKCEHRGFFPLCGTTLLPYTFLPVQDTLNVAYVYIDQLQTIMKGHPIQTYERKWVKSAAGLGAQVISTYQIQYARQLQLYH